MSTITDAPVKVKKDKKDKKEKKEKKEKSSKKRKAEEIAEPTAPAVVEKDDQETEAVENNDSDDNDAASSHPSKKRKGSPIPEIEVDVSLPEPPSKKELRRLKKGKSVPASKSAVESAGEPTETIDEDGKVTVLGPKKVEQEKRSPHGVWIGNLPWSVTKDSLRSFFVENSDIITESITRIHMPSPDDGKPVNRISTAPAWKKQNNKGFAYVDFLSAADVAEAVSLSEELLQGRRVLIKDNKSFEGRPLKVKDETGATKVDGKEPSKRIFIGNLRFDATEDSIKEHFEQCGEIETCMIATFEDSGKCKGYGWITFVTLEAAEAAVRGWVAITEESEESESESDDESDSASDSEAEAKETKSDDDSDSEAEAKPKKVTAKISKSSTRKPTIRKRFIDKIQMRPIRREFAEAPQVRYKKRYGKDGTKNQNAAGRGDGDAGGAAVDGATQAQDRARKPRAEEKKSYVPLGTSYAPRLTGAIRASEGKKVTF